MNKTVVLSEMLEEARPLEDLEDQLSILNFGKSDLDQIEKEFRTLSEIANALLGNKSRRTELRRGSLLLQSPLEPENEESEETEEAGVLADADNKNLQEILSEFPGDALVDYYGWIVKSMDALLISVKNAVKESEEVNLSLKGMGLYFMSSDTRNDYKEYSIQTEVVAKALTSMLAPETVLSWNTAVNYAIDIKLHFGDFEVMATRMEEQIKKQIDAAAKNLGTISSSAGYKTATLALWSAIVYVRFLALDLEKADTALNLLQAKLETFLDQADETPPGPIDYTWLYSKDDCSAAVQSTAAFQKTKDTLAVAISFAVKYTTKLMIWAKSQSGEKEDNLRENLELASKFLESILSILENFGNLFALSIEVQTNRGTDDHRKRMNRGSFLEKVSIHTHSRSFLDFICRRVSEGEGFKLTGT